MPRHGGAGWCGAVVAVVVGRGRVVGWWGEHELDCITPSPWMKTMFLNNDYNDRIITIRVKVLLHYYYTIAYIGILTPMT